MSYIGVIGDFRVLRLMTFSCGLTLCYCLFVILSY